MDKIETIKFAKQYLEDLLTFFDLNLDVDVKIEDDIVVAAVPHSDKSSILIGRNAETLCSIQYLLSATLNNAGAPVSRVNLDIVDYKKQHVEKIIEKACGWIEEVRRTGESKIVNLNAADRWTVHHLASEYSDI